MDQREELARLGLEPGANVSDLARRFGIDRKTARKWIARARTGEAMAERSRKPAHSPMRTDAAIEAAVLALRQAHPAWGGRKLQHVLLRQSGHAPAPSTITAILRRHGVAVGELGGGAKPFVRFEHDAPNDLWQMDFKGHVPMAQGRLHPLTVLDDHSRFCVTLAACTDERTASVKTHLQRAFARYGLPCAIITDNGAPWGDGPGSPFTPLGVWLIEHDIRIAHARAYHPQTMGKDERFHRSLKLEVLRERTFANLAEAKRALARWRTIYNGQRPHQAIGYAAPAERYRPSPRSYRQRVEPFAYRNDDIMAHVRDGGRITVWRRQFRVPKAFRGKDVALRLTPQDGLYAVFFRNVEIARLDRKSGKRYPPNPATMSPNTWP